MRLDHFNEYYNLLWDTQMKFLLEVVTNRINTWNGILFSVKVNGHLGFKCTFRAQIASSKIRFQNQMNNREDPYPVRKGTGSSVMYTKYAYRQNRNSLVCIVRALELSTTVLSCMNRTCIYRRPFLSPLDLMRLLWHIRSSS